MDPLTLLALGVVSLALGSVLGYYARQTIAKKQIGSLEIKIQKKIAQARDEAAEILTKANKEAEEILEKARKEEKARRRELIKAERFLLKREGILQAKIAKVERKEREIFKKADEIKELRQELEKAIKKETKKLEEISGLSAEEAKRELFNQLQREYQQEILERITKLESQGKEKLEEKAKKILMTAIQRCALSLVQETTTTTVNLPSDKIKGRIIGKEGRNIRAFEKATGVELIIDEAPEAVLLSSFSPIRRYIAKVALEKLIEDGRIQPARIEEVVRRTEEEVMAQIKEAGEAAVYEAGIIDLPPKLIELLGRLRFRTSFGQNVLLHSIEVSHLASMIAQELGADIKVAKKAGLLHDIGKALDHQVEGSHTDIGIKILERFGVEKEVINAMKSHHEEYPYESIEAQIVQVADQISGARPGARKDTLENYLKRLEELEKIATSFPGVEKAYAIQAGREVRVFVNPQEIDDLASYNLARGIAKRIQEELRYPGEIKVVVIRENRVVEYAK
jgi:ribonuclease Y